jgi:penicillin-binding protein 1C
MKKTLNIIILSFLLLISVTYASLYLFPVPSLLNEYSFSKAVYDDQHHLLRLTLSKDQQYRVYTPLADIPLELREATLLQEDKYFRWHFGLNPLSLCKAVWQTYIVKSRKVGASTITMQLARIRFGINSKVPLGKVEQIIRALQLEAHYSKDEILEAYLNLAPYGGNIEGVGAASLIYFHHPVNKVTLPQAITLSVIPQNPINRRPSNAALKSIRDRLYARWLASHAQDQNKQKLFSLPLAMYRIADLPFKAPHFVSRVLDNSLAEHALETTLDAGAQALIERITHRYLEQKHALGVYNAAILLIDTRDMGAKALLGSADFFNQPISGQINGVEIKRSPGSTLKPFIYGLAMDQGLIHPNTVLKDVQQSFNGYNPENFDYDFMGPIKAKDALVLSRNIPAVYLSSQLKNETLYRLLEKAQVAGLKPESYYGLSINLGGAELTMKELVSLYAALVNDGVWYPVNMLKNGKKEQGTRLLSREASFLVLDMLQSVSREGLVHEDLGRLPVAWKTGTSSGYRDAWAVGAFGPYVLGVWVGNFDNKANPAFIGKEIAAPLFWRLTQAITQELGPLTTINPHPETMNLKKLKVCKVSGLLPTPYCPDTELSWFIPGKSPIKKDTIFREVAINDKTGLRTCHIDGNTSFEVFEFWPSDLLAIFKRAGIQRHTPPFFEPGCSSTSNGSMSPQITSPQTGIDYVLSANSDEHNKILFTAVTDSGIAHLYWFINESLVATTRADENFFWHARPGSFVVRVVDDQGLSDVREITVRLQG